MVVVVMMTMSMILDAVERNLCMSFVIFEEVHVHSIIFHGICCTLVADGAVPIIEPSK